MAMPQQTEIIKRLRAEVADYKSQVVDLHAEIRSMNDTITSKDDEIRTLTEGNLKLQEAMEHQRSGLQADLDGASRRIEELTATHQRRIAEANAVNTELRNALETMRTQRDEALNSVTEEVAIVESVNFDERQDLLKGLERIVIALGRSA